MNSQQSTKLYTFEFTEREFLHVYGAVQHDRNRTLKAIRKGLAVTGDLKATDSLWDKLGAVMFRRFKGDQT